MTSCTQKSPDILSVCRSRVLITNLKFISDLNLICNLITSQVWLGFCGRQTGQDGYREASSIDFGTGCSIQIFYYLLSNKNLGIRTE